MLPYPSLPFFLGLRALGGTEGLATPIAPTRRTGTAPEMLEREGCSPRSVAMGCGQWIGACYSASMRIMAAQEGISSVRRGLVGLYLLWLTLDRRFCYVEGEPVTSSLCSYCGILWFSPWRISDSEDTASATYTITESRVRASRGHPWISVCPGRSTKSECIRTCHRDAGTASPAATPVHYIPSTSPRVAFCDIPNLQSLTLTYVQSRHHARRRPSRQLASSLPPSLV